MVFFKALWRDGWNWADFIRGAVPVYSYQQLSVFTRAKTSALCLLLAIRLNQHQMQRHISREGASYLPDYFHGKFKIDEKFRLSELASISMPLYYLVGKDKGVRPTAFRKLPGTGFYYTNQYLRGERSDTGEWNLNLEPGITKGPIALMLGIAFVV
jgi:hypothetical protein